MNDTQIINTIHTDIPYPDRDKAIAALNAFTGHRIGQLISILYRSPHPEDNVLDVEILVAVGIKDAYKCGISGVPSDDAWENKYYTKQPHGMEFWRLVFDSGQIKQESDIPGGGSNPLDTLGLTHIKISGDEYDVVNPDGDDRSVDDPFIFNNLNRDGEENDG